MGSHEKLLKRFLSFPKDFSWNELNRFLNKYGYYQNNKGKTSGSRVSFEKDDSNKSLNLHKSHPKNVLKPYHIKDVFEFLQRIDVLK